MAIITIDNLAAGMLLRSNVCDRSGRLLLPAGNELTDKHLRVFRTWGIIEADITGDDSAESDQPLPGEEIDPALRAEAEAAVALMFAQNNREHPAIMELERLCIRRRIAHAS